MVQSSVFYRDQESIQRSRAADTPIENVRLIATDAAAAWAKEAVSAECRESRRLHDRTVALALGAGKFDDATMIDLFQSENPDRGFADISLVS